MTTEANYPSTDPADIRRQAELWKATLRVPVTVVRDPEGVDDAGIRGRILSGAKIRGWKSPEKGYFIYLPAFRDTAELDSSVMHEVVGSEGARALFSQPGWDRMRDLIWDRMYETERNKYIAQTGGDPSDLSSWRAAAQAFMETAAKRLATHDDRHEKAYDEWNFVMNCLYTSNGPVSRNLGIPRKEFSRLFAAATRMNVRDRMNAVPQLTRGQMSAVIDAALDDLEMRRNSVRNGDLGKTYDLGFPGRVYMACAPKAKRFPMKLRLAALFGRNGEKQERHYYPFTSIKGLVEALENPLAVVDSRDPEKSGTLVIVTRLKIEKDGETHYFVVPVTPRKKEPEGVWINNIDSIYQKSERHLLHWIRDGKKLARYLAPDLETTFIEPAKARFEASVAEAEAEKTIPGQTATGSSLRLTRNLTPPDTPESRPVEERADMVRAEFDVATKVVRNFENPSVPDENVRFFQNVPAKSQAAPKESNPLSLYNFLSDTEKVDLVGTEFRQSVAMLLTKDAISPSHTPRFINGQAITEAGGLNLRMRMLCTPRWETPFFVSQQQAASLGVRTTGPSSSVIYLNKEKNEFRRAAVFNLADTTFPEKFPTTYQTLCDRYSTPPPRLVEDVNAVVEDAWSRSFSDNPVDRMLVEFAVKAAAGKSFSIPKAEREMLAEDLDALGNDGLYRIFESAGRRWTNACRKARILPEKEESMDVAIEHINARNLVRNAAQGRRIGK